MAVPRERRRSSSRWTCSGSMRATDVTPTPPDRRARGGDAVRRPTCRTASRRRRLVLEPGERPARPPTADRDECSRRAIEGLRAEGRHGPRRRDRPLGRVGARPAGRRAVEDAPPPEAPGRRRAAAPARRARCSPTARTPGHATSRSTQPGRPRTPRRARVHGRARHREGSVEGPDAGDLQTVPVPPDPETLHGSPSGRAGSSSRRPTRLSCRACTRSSAPAWGRRRSSAS